MYRRIISLFLSTVLMFTSLGIVAFAEDEIKVVLNGEELLFDVPPQSIDGRTMVPMRKIFEAMGAIVNWDNGTQTVTAVRDDTTVIMQINNPTVRVNFEEIVLDVPPQIIDTRTLVPARAVAESLDADVVWDGDTRTVIITDKEPDSDDASFVDLNESTEFMCIANPTILYGIEDIWYGTVGTGMLPTFIQKDKAYRGQVVVIAPLYANYVLDENGSANVTFDIKVKYPSGEENVMGTDIPAFVGKGESNLIIKSMYNIEYWIEDGDELGTYTFTVDSKDNIANKTFTSVFDIEFVEYKYEKNEFKSESELLEYISGYGLNPDPDRIIDAIIFAEKNDISYYPTILGALIEMYGKNPYLAEEAVIQFEKEFGPDGTEMLNLIDSTAATYYQNLLANNPPTMTNVSYDVDVAGDIMGYGMNMGIYFASCSYNVAVALAESYAKDNFSDELLAEYGIPRFEDVFGGDPLFMAYCYRMIHYDNQVSNVAKEKLLKLFN